MATGLALRMDFGHPVGHTVYGLTWWESVVRVKSEYSRVVFTSKRAGFESDLGSSPVGAVCEGLRSENDLQQLVLGLVRKIRTSECRRRRRESSDLGWDMDGEDQSLGRRRLWRPWEFRLYVDVLLFTASLDRISSVWRYPFGERQSTTRRSVSARKNSTYS